ncbi:MAG TPA: serine hydrolase [Pyrinomonadaceae bacterium]|nr:serine hydrolase [Pyrinomonadaceae bacterium]
MKTAKSLALLLLLFITANSSFAQQTARQIDELMKKYYDYGQFNGSILVAEKGQVVYAKGLGFANMEWSIPNQPDTKFRIGSITKQFTATLILQLVEDGKLKLDGKITDYLTDYRKDTGDRVTIHQLLNHTSGIPSYTARPDFRTAIMRNPYKVADFVKQLASGDLEFEPGAKFSYNNSGYILLGAIIEKVTGKSYETVLTERILKPLGMTNSGYDTTSPLMPKRASGYQKQPSGYVNAPYLDMSLPYAAGSIYSTVEDLYKWDQALHEGKILSAESRKLMFTPGLSTYGYGIRVTDEAIGNSALKTKLIGHTGGINGFNSLLTRAVDKGQTVIILDNVAQGRRHGPITTSIIGILNGQSYDPPKQSIAEALYKIAEKDVAAAVAEYRKLKATKADSYDFAETELQTLGYQLVELKQLKEAVEIFKLNIEMFPKSSNSYDSLGETYLELGQKDLALTNYKKAVELNPANANAVRIVNQIEGKTAKVDTSVFDAYVGDYELNPTFILSVLKEGDKLFVKRGSQPKMDAEAVSDTQFSVPQVKASLTFEKDSTGKVTGLLLTQGTRQLQGKKIK